MNRISCFIVLLTIGCNSTPVSKQQKADIPGQSLDASYISADSVYHSLPQDEGWTVLQPSSTSQIFYVSKEGDDNSATAHTVAELGETVRHPDESLIKPFKSIEVALSHTREGMGDWVLVRRGDDFLIDENLVIKNGESSTNRSVVSSYGPLDRDRPLIRTGTSGAFNAVKGLNNVAITGLHFYAHLRNPNSDAYSIEGKAGFRFLAAKDSPLTNILIEDCHFNYFTNNIIEDRVTDDSSGIVIRRNSITNNYSNDGHSQGLYLSHIRDAVIEENFFDHNGWLIQGGGPALACKKKDEAKVGGQATCFNHNTYFNSMSDTVMRNNLFLRASSMGNKWRSDRSGGSKGLRIYNNFYYGGEIGVGIGGNTGEPGRFTDVEVFGNVMTNIGDRQPTGRTLAWYLHVNGWQQGKVYDNLLVNQKRPENTNTVALKIGDGKIAVSGNSSVEIFGNTVYGLKSTRPLVELHDYLDNSGESLQFFQNRIIGTNRNHPLFMLNSLDVYQLESNSYGSTSGNVRFVYRDSELDFEGWSNLDSVTNSLPFTDSFVNTKVSLASYTGQFDREGLVSNFIRAAKTQRQGNWDERWTADKVIQYYRQGFSILEQPASIEP